MMEEIRTHKMAVLGFTDWDSVKRNFIGVIGFQLVTSSEAHV